jgi:hypothetical protein
MANGLKIQASPHFHSLVSKQPGNDESYSGDHLNTFLCRINRPYTDFAKGTTGVRVLKSIDIAVRHAESFAAMQDAIA